MGYWFWFDCRSCGYAITGDGDVPPEDIRLALLAAHGTWELINDAADETRLPLARFLVEELGIERAAAVQLANTRGKPLSTGTRIAMAYLGMRLEERGIATHLSRLA